jgi:hypothetical protein
MLPARIAKITVCKSLIAVTNRCSDAHRYGSR